MDLFQAMRMFVKVAEAGSFSGAARLLDTSNPSVTRNIADLEAYIGARLFNRSTRRLSLTEVGSNYLERCQQVLLEVDNAVLEAGISAANPTGTLRMTVPMSFAVNHLGRILPEYLRRYPNVKLDISLSDRVVNLVDEGYDLGIRIGRIQDSSLIARKIAPARLILCASPAYLEKYGTPLAPQDIERQQHVCLRYSYATSPDVWTFVKAGKTHAVKLSGSVTANNGDILREAAIGGMGLAMQPSFIVGNDIRNKKLVHLLPDYVPPASMIQAVYASRQHLSAKVRTFVDYLIEQFGDQPCWDNFDNEEKTKQRKDTKKSP
ncbi:LysR family transcriptional regulator [Undibacterium sp.]|jgi:DNA-binding transcriptional LysR family regulator|uniref:LysR family transcriptional regulator n=1 Tax=Undibacterium sp. TaxID=1914977 RepID=UPI002BD4674D|nr:LysR family transcriptional regulator [Undibacterium sp.]HTD04416.1 LysR family transcriptional regulator [Undibacterium sp.]